MRCYYLIVVQVYYFEPVLYTTNSCFVFFWKHKPYEVLVIHFIFRRAFEPSGNLVKYTVNSLSGKGVTFVSREILLIYKKIVVCIQLPEPTIKDVKMLIGKVLAYNVDIVFVAHLYKSFH